MMTVLTTALSKTLPQRTALKLEQSLTSTFFKALLIHIAFWTLLPLLLQKNVSLDMVEGLAWGREWQLGYEKDPPLFPWVIELLTTFSGKGLWISYLAGQLCVGTVFFSVWQLGRRIASDSEALVGALLLEGIYYFNYPTPEFNDIILQMPFAALFGWLMHKAIKEDRLADWVLTGIVASLGLWSRYSMGAYLLPMALFMLVHPQARQRLATRGPWIFLATTTITFLPHLAWIVNSGFISIIYVGRRAPEITGFAAYLGSVVSFMNAQLAAMLPMLLVAVALWRWRAARSWFQLRWANVDHAYLMALALGPIAISLILSLIARRPLRVMWGAPLWCFASLFLVMAIRPVLTPQRLRYLKRAWLGLLLLPVVLFSLEHMFAAKVTGHEKKTHFPGAELGEAVTARWHGAIHSPLKYVAGDTWFAGNVSYYARERPSTMFSHGSYLFSPWINRQDIKQSGTVLVWDARAEGEAVPPELVREFPNAVLQAPLALNGDVSTHRIGLAFVPPETLETPGSQDLADFGED